MVLYMQMMGGLGNLMFQVAAGYAMARDNGDRMVISTTTQGITKRPQEHTWFKSVLKSFQKVKTVPRVNHTIREKKFNHHKLKYRSNSKLFGYFQSEKYFKKYKNDIVKMFTKHQKVIQDTLDKKFPVTEKKTVSVHIRRTDYIKLAAHHENHGTEYVAKALFALSEKLGYGKDMKKFNEMCKLVVFSDDIAWCKSNDLFKYFDCHFMEGNSDIEDLYLMSMCDHHIIVNSSFSWWGSYLNQKEGKVIIAPSVWFGPKGAKEWSDIYTDDMIVI